MFDFSCVANPVLGSSAATIEVSVLQDQDSGLLLYAELESLGSLFMFGEATDGVPVRVDHIVYQDERTALVLRLDFTAEGVIDRIVGPSGTVFVDYGTPDEGLFTLVDAATGGPLLSMDEPALWADMRALSRNFDPSGRLFSTGAANIIIGALGIATTFLSAPALLTATGLWATLGWAGILGGQVGGIARLTKGVMQIAGDGLDPDKANEARQAAAIQKVDEYLDPLIAIGGALSLPLNLANASVASFQVLKSTPAVLSRMELLDATAGPVIDFIGFGLDEVANTSSTPTGANIASPVEVTTSCPAGWVRCACPAAHVLTISVDELCRDGDGRLWHSRGHECP
ncbi:MAG: hypothetical protein H6818_03150 [Phycisphaerales bacterium]|nr:hypothetical protein [Phycisphaerales bacterium]